MPAKLTKQRFIERAKAAHGDKFDYSKVEYVNANTKVTIICPDHGPFQQRPANHFNGFGCAECSGKRQHTTNTFTERARAAHGDRFDYSASAVSGNNQTQITIICPDHGPFRQRINDHLNGFGCPSCANTGPSSTERSLADFISTLGVPVVQNDRTLLKGKELDILCPLHGLAIEYNGLYWHSDLTGKPKDYHLKKTQACNAAGFRLIHIFEGDDLAQAKKLIAHALGANRAKPIHARKCETRPIESKTAHAFLEEHHPQGHVTASHHIGAYYEGELVAVSSFGAPFRSKIYKHELKRHATRSRVVGALGKAVAHYARAYMTPGEKLGSLCDLSRYDGGSYEAAGFTLDAVLPPDYTYAVNKKRVHKSRYQKAGIARLLPEHYDASKTEREMMVAAGVGRVYDCGKARYIFTA